MASSSPNGSKDKDSLGNKLSETFNSLKKNDKIDNLYKYAQDNTRDSVAYVLLIFGIILLFFKPSLGGALIGVIVGIYLYNEIVGIANNVHGFIEDQGIARSLVLGGVFLAFFISAPMIFIGAAIGIGIKHLVGEPNRA